MVLQKQEQRKSGGRRRGQYRVGAKGAVFGKPKLKEREQAIELRRQGLTYREILEKVPVAKSTLSLWLGDVGLSEKQKQRISDKKRAAALRGALRRRTDRIQLTEKITSKARTEIGKITDRELWLIGIALYWAEGAKEKEWRPGTYIDFSNSDPHMARLFIAWLIRCCGVEKENIKVSIYIHENSRGRIEAVIRHWAHWTTMPKKSFGYVYFKKHNPKTKRKNIGHSYFGNVRIRVSASSTLARAVAGWVQGIHENYSGLV